MKKLRIILVSILLLVVGAILYNDAKRFDTADGAYEYPYVGYTGYSFDFENFVQTATGLRDTRGIIMEFEINCTTGQIKGFFGPIPIPIKKISERAIIIHKPQAACIARGFLPEWKY